MIKQRSPKQASRPSWLVSRSYLVPSVFAIAFAGVALSLLYGGHAQIPCAKQVITIGQSNNCVLDAQQMLNATDSHWGGTYAAENGVFSDQTRGALIQLQSTKKRQLSPFTEGVGTGNLNVGTWQELCYADNIWQGNKTPFIAAGCQVVFGVGWGDNYSQSSSNE